MYAIMIIMNDGTANIITQNFQSDHKNICVILENMGAKSVEKFIYNTEPMPVYVKG